MLLLNGAMRVRLSLLLVCFVLTGAAAVCPPRLAEAGLLGRLVERARYGKVRAKQRRQIRTNRRVGARRERRVERWTRLRHFSSSVQRQKDLLDRRGRPALDPVTRQGRRMDLAVITPFGRLSTLIEITSRSANKREQEAKTRRILKRYRKLYIRDDRGQLRPVRRGLLLPTRFKTVRAR
jgi:hypothetical protein